LNRGNFIVSIGRGESFEVEISKRLLGHKNSMKSERWEELRKEQLKKYYVKKSNPHEREQVITDSDIQGWKKEDEENEKKGQGNNPNPPINPSDFNTPFGL
jgi:hypothetical protein